MYPGLPRFAQARMTVSWSSASISLSTIAFAGKNSRVKIRRSRRARQLIGRDQNVDRLLQPCVVHVAKTVWRPRMIHLLLTVVSNAQARSSS